MLVLLNGPPAAGKSSVARRWVENRPLALNLDLDQLWPLFGCWRDDPAATGSAVRELALAMCRAQLAAGRDVILPQLVARPEFLDQLAVIGGSAFRHIVLLPPLPVVRLRFTERPDHPVAERQQRSVDGVAGVEELYRGLVELVRERPDAEIMELSGREDLETVSGRLTATLANDPTESAQPG